MSKVYPDQYPSSSEDESNHNQEPDSGQKDKYNFEFEVTKNLKKRHNTLINEIDKEVNQ